MDRLNKLQRTLLKRIEPYDTKEEFFVKLGEGKIVIDGFAKEKVIVYMEELSQIGYLKILYNYDRWGGGKTPSSFALSSNGKDYDSIIRSERISQLIEYLKTFLIAVSGGLVVFLLGRLLS